MKVHEQFVVNISRNSGRIQNSKNESEKIDYNYIYSPITNNIRSGAFTVCGRRDRVLAKHYSLKTRIFIYQLYNIKLKLKKK